MLIGVLLCGFDVADDYTDDVLVVVFGDTCVCMCVYICMVCVVYQ